MSLHESLSANRAQLDAARNMEQRVHKLDKQPLWSVPNPSTAEMERQVRADINRRELDRGF